MKPTTERQDHSLATDLLAIMVDQHSNVVGHFHDRACPDVRLDFSPERRVLEQGMAERVEQQPPHVFLEDRAARVARCVD